MLTWNHFVASLTWALFTVMTELMKLTIFILINYLLNSKAKRWNNFLIFLLNYFTSLIDLQRKSLIWVVCIKCTFWICWCTLCKYIWINKNFFLRYCWDRSLNSLPLQYWFNRFHSWYICPTFWIYFATSSNIFFHSVFATIVIISQHFLSNRKYQHTYSCSRK